MISKKEAIQAIRKWEQEKQSKTIVHSPQQPILTPDTIICGDNIEVMRTFPSNYFDTIITDPPYGLKFMGKKWDYDVPSIETWRECLRVLKPGGTLLCFAGSRTQHRMAVNVEDAGFILKDCIMWLYGSGFPKAMDISKQLDKIAGVERETIGSRKAHDIRSNNLMEASQGKGRGTMEYNYTAPPTPEAQLWDGWKSHGLKPAYEPILVAMKPNSGTYANNALKWGVSGLNIDGGRVPTEEVLSAEYGQPSGSGCYNWNTEKTTLDKTGALNTKGRFPANVILDEEAGRMLDEQAPRTGGGHWSGKVPKDGGLYKLGLKPMEDKGTDNTYAGASRFFYCTKASKKERNIGCEDLAFERHADRNMTDGVGGDNPRNRTNIPKQNYHPTVKPLALMEYLCKLTKTPTGGIVLDPFCGSGTTCMACVKTGRKYIGIDDTAEYCEIARKRIKGVNRAEKY